MKLSREALSKIFNTFRATYREQDKVKPSADWQNKLMDEIRKQPAPARRCCNPLLYLFFILVLLALLYLVYVWLQS